MCQICRHSPCLNGCPNAPDPPAVTTCRKCGEPITPGYEFARIDGLDYCDECIDDMPYCELVPLLGGKWEPVPVGRIVKCGVCGRVIEPDEEYGTLDGRIYCEDCIDEVPYCELVTMAGHDWRTASEEDIYDGYDG